MTFTKKLLLIGVFILSTAYNIFSQNYIVMVKDISSGKWGYANIKGEMVIPAIYKKCYPFSEGLALVLDEMTGRFIIITPTGEQLKTEIENFEFKGEFHDGMLRIRVRDRWGFMDANGKVVIEPKYEGATEFSSGFAVVMNRGKDFIVDKKGNEIIPEKRVKGITHFTEGLAPFIDGNNKGFIDGTGKIVIEPKFQNVGFFKGGLAWAKELDGKGGYINIAGEWVIPPTFTSGNEFDPISGITVIRNGLIPAYINKEGKVLSINPSESFHEFSEGLCEGKKGLFWGYYDANGHWIVQPKFDGVRPFKNGYAAVKVKEKWGIIDTSGKYVIEPVFDSVRDVEVY